MNLVREEVQQMSIDDLLQIVEDQEQFERDGFIDDCLLRRTARKVSKDGSIVIWMNMVSFEVYRQLAQERIEYYKKALGRT